MPHSAGSTKGEPYLANKIHQIGARHAASPDTLVRLKTSWIGRFYISHLKVLPLVRWIAILTWRTVYPLYVRYVAVIFASKNQRRWRSINRLVDHVEIMGISTVKLFAEEQVETPAPIVFPTKDQNYLKSPHDSYTSATVYVANIGSAVVHGGTNLVTKDNNVICHDLYDFDRDYTSEELHGRHLIDVKRKRIRLLTNDEAPEHISLAAAFVDACAPNYAHWLTEVLPRIVSFCVREEFKQVPIVINDGLHKNIMESLVLAVGHERDIFLLPIGRSLLVDSLFMTSATGYVPFGRRSNKLLGHSHGRFSPPAFSLVRKLVRVCSENSANLNLPEKIYLRRNSGSRKVINSTALETFLLSRGYVVIEPEQLTFSQQVVLFSSAKYIVASSGAAVSNMIFAPKAAFILILIGKYSDTSYYYWQNMICAVQNQINYVLGDILETSNGIHSDFSVSIDTLSKSPL